jgi:hypothetical protein
MPEKCYYGELVSAWQDHYIYQPVNLGNGYRITRGKLTFGEAYCGGRIFYFAISSSSPQRKSPPAYGAGVLPLDTAFTRTGRSFKLGDSLISRDSLGYKPKPSAIESRVVDRPNQVGYGRMFSVNGKEVHGDKRSLPNGVYFVKTRNNYSKILISR